MGRSRRSHFSNNRHFKSPSLEKMALRVGSSMLLRSMRSQAFNNSRAMSQMAFTFAAPNGVHYNAASVKQIDVPSFSGSFGIYLTMCQHWQSSLQELSLFTRTAVIPTNFLCHQGPSL